MSDDLQLALREHFGFDDFRPGQREVIANLLAGRSAAAVFPTGGGKSLCFQLPSLMLDGLTLVVSPLIALMKDQIDALAARGIAAQRLDSTLTINEYAEVMRAVRNGELRMLYVAPERFNNERFRNMVINSRIALFAIDEAHCISEWGHNFRPDYLKLAQFAHRCQAERVLALTATATPQVQDDICEAFDIAPDCLTCTGFYRPNLTLRYAAVTAEQRDDALLDQLRNRDSGPTIVYVTLQQTAEELADVLARAGFSARAYHAGMKDEDRTDVQDWFLASDDGIVVATIAFGMGIDKPDIRYIYHYNLPKSLENYSQEIGRAGRDEQPSTCEMLVCPDDMNTLENFAYGNTPRLEDVRAMLDRVLGQGDSFHVSYFELAKDHDIRILVVRTLLTYLELMEILEGGTPFYTSHQFKPLMSSKQILSRFQDERRSFVSKVLAQARKRSVWFDIDVDAAARAAGASRQRVLAALDYLAEQQMIELRAQGVSYPYRRLQQVPDTEALSRELFNRLKEREKREVERVAEVVELAGLDNCQTAALGEYFGELRGEPCGHCSWCLNGQQAIALVARTSTEMTDQHWAIVDALKREFPNLADRPHSLARLLCGVTSPWLSRQRLTRHARFGAASEVPFPQVLEALVQQHQSSSATTR